MARFLVKSDLVATLKEKMATSKDDSRVEGQYGLRRRIITAVVFAIAVMISFRFGRIYQALKFNTKAFEKLEGECLRQLFSP